MYTSDHKRVWQSCSIAPLVVRKNKIPIKYSTVIAYMYHQRSAPLGGDGMVGWGGGVSAGVGRFSDPRAASCTLVLSDGWSLAAVHKTKTK